MMARYYILPSGVYFYYMAAGIKLSAKAGNRVLIETQGRQWRKAQLKQKDIDRRPAWFWSTTWRWRGLDRFKGKRLLKMGVSDLIRSPTQ